MIAPLSPWHNMRAVAVRACQSAHRRHTPSKFATIAMMQQKVGSENLNWIAGTTFVPNGAVGVAPSGRITIGTDIQFAGAEKKFLGTIFAKALAELPKLCHSSCDSTDGRSVHLDAALLLRLARVGLPAGMPHDRLVCSTAFAACQGSGNP